MAWSSHTTCVYCTDVFVELYCKVSCQSAIPGVQLHRSMEKFSFKKATSPTNIPVRTRSQQQYIDPAPLQSSHVFFLPRLLAERDSFAGAAQYSPTGIRAESPKLKGDCDRFGSIRAEFNQVTPIRLYLANSAIRLAHAQPVAPVAGIGRDDLGVGDAANACGASHHGCIPARGGHRLSSEMLADFERLSSPPT